MIKKFTLTLLLAFLFCAAVCGQKNTSAKQEMRAGWMASVANINWPAKKGLTNEELKKGFISYLDSLVAVNANAVVMQVRPTGDSFYPCSIEPWSIYLTGVQGKAPSVMWDPMEFMIREAHKRGLEFHAWMNPYRVAQHNDSTLISENHLMRTHPEWFVQYGKQWYYDPGEPGCAEYTNAVVKEYISRYDVDGVHFDDYFYPYKVSEKDANGKNQVVDFPDSLSWKKYGADFFANKEDWRRNNVDKLIKMLSETIKSTKPWVKFGISPFGVWRNNDVDPVRGSATKAGCQNYDDLYADILLWLEKGWIDYVTPQLYWKIGKEIVDYPILLDWWIKYSYGRQLYVGHSMGNGAPEIKAQVDMLRGRGQDKVQGSFYWNASSILRNSKDKATGKLMNSMLRAENPYTALTPTMPWMDMTAPATPSELKATGAQHLVDVSWIPSYTDNLMYFLVYKFPKGTKIDTSVPNYIIGKTWYDNETVSHFYDRSGNKGEYTYVVTAVSRNSIESAPIQKVVKISKDVK